MPLESMSQGIQNELHSEEGQPQVLVELLGQADVRFNGDRPWDIQVHDEMLFKRVLTHGSLGFGEAYMDGFWDCSALDELFSRLMAVDIDEQLAGWFKFRLISELIRQYLFNLQSTRRAFQVGEKHYDIGNDVFEAMFDSGMCYSCGYWERTDELMAEFQSSMA